MLSYYHVLTSPPAITKGLQSFVFCLDHMLISREPVRWRIWQADGNNYKAAINVK